MRGHPGWPLADRRPGRGGPARDAGEGDAVSISRPPDMDAPLTDAEVRELFRVAPNKVREMEDGQLIPLVSRREIYTAQLLYPSCDPRQAAAPPARLGDGRDDLRARYHSMFKTS